MKSAAASQLKASLSKYLKWVKAGEEVLVTERGNPIAKLTPISGIKTEKHLQEMEKQGLVRLGSANIPEEFWSMPRPKDLKDLALKSLIEEREASR